MWRNCYLLFAISYIFNHAGFDCASAAYMDHFFHDEWANNASVEPKTKNVVRHAFYATRSFTKYLTHRSHTRSEKITSVVVGLVSNDELMTSFYDAGHF